jgi:predicted glycoside hydrolase/deacetylase ChbG (UPF0249 family)
MRKLIINADDFGYSPGINKGIIEAHTRGVVTSTSVMVNAIAADEAATLKDHPELSVGLHLQLNNPVDAAAELPKQVDRFVSITGAMPTHIDIHKTLDRSSGLDDVLAAFAKEHRVPVRDLGFAKFINTFYAKRTDGDVSVAEFKRAVDQATDECNEIMCHVGYCDAYILEHSSYNTHREEELLTVCDPEVRAYIDTEGLELISWRDVVVHG